MELFGVGTSVHGLHTIFSLGKSGFWSAAILTLRLGFLLQKIDIPAMALDNVGGWIRLPATPHTSAPHTQSLNPYTVPPSPLQSCIELGCRVGISCDGFMGL